MGILASTYAPELPPENSFFRSGGIDSMAIFNTVMAKMKKKWGTNFDVKHKVDSRTTTVPETGAKQIVDDMLLFSDWAEMLLEYFREVLVVLRKYRVTINLKKCRFFPEKAEFVGVDVRSDGNSPADSKFKAMLKMVESPPSAATDLLALIGFLGFCQELIPHYEVRIRPWRNYKKSGPPCCCS